MRTRIVYTVIRNASDPDSIGEAKEAFAHIVDEVGEFLYGGMGGDEQISAVLQVSEDGVVWKTIL
jgi:hypothetical protein